MTTYKTVAYDTTTALRDAINADLSGLAYPFSVKHRLNGIGWLVSAKAPLTGDSLYVTIDFDSIGSKVFALKTLFESRLLEMPEDLKTGLFEAQSAFQSEYLDLEKAKREASRLAWVQAKQAEEDKKAEARYQATKARTIEEFQVRTKKERTVSTTSEFWYSLGWIANNCGAFACVLPDYLLPYFQTQFGTTYNPRIVDSKKKTANGNSMQWTISMTANIKKKSIAKVPAFLTTYLSKSGNAVADTDFIWDLVASYGFQFGKTQDIDKIRATVPADYIEYFEKGYAE